MANTRKILLPIVLIAIVAILGTYLVLNAPGYVAGPQVSSNDTEINEAVTTGLNNASQIKTKIFTNTSGDYSVNYPADWNQGVNGAPDPALIETVYFFRSPAEQSKGFDTVNITKFSSKGASYEELLEQNPDHVIQENKGMTYVLTYSNENFPEETRKIFKLVSDSFQMN